MAIELTRALGQTIRKARLEAAMTQDGLAELAMVDRTYISILERGLKSPTLETLERIAMALGTSSENLIAGARTPSSGS